MSFLRPLSSSPRSLPLSHNFRMFSTTRTCPLAKISIVGRLGATPELSPTSTGLDVIRYSVATKVGPIGNERVSWWRINHYIKDQNKMTELLLSLEKGTLIYVDGTASLGRYEAKDGTSVHSVNIVQRHFDVIQRKKKETTEGEGEGEGEGEHDQGEESKPA